MEKTAKQRLIEYLEYKGIGRNKFEAMAGLSMGYITKLKNAPRPEKLVDILHAAPDLNKVWLLTGEGEMLTSDVTPLVRSELTEYATSKNGLNFQQREDGMILMTVPVVPFRALGSPDDEFAQLIREDDVETMQFLVDGVHHGNYIAFRVEGDSMDDGKRESFARGDMVLVRELSRDKWLPKLHIGKWPYWVINWDNNVRIKEIVSQDDLGNITLHSLNPSPEYCDFTINLEDVRRLFNVVQKVPKPTKYGI